MKLTLWMACLAIIALPLTAGAADPARLALARQVVGLAFPGAGFDGSFLRTARSMAKAVSVEAAFDAAQARPENDHTPPPPDAKFDDAALGASLALGIGQISPGYQEAVAEAYADAFTDAQLNAMLAFFTSPGGRAAIADRKAFAARQNALPAEDPFNPPQKPPPAYVETAPERAFDASPTGRTLKQHEDAMGKQIMQSMRTLWPQATQAAEADYCRRQACGAPEREVFKRLAKIWEEPAQPTGH